jgi:CHAD domain-containing protein
MTKPKKPPQPPGSTIRRDSTVRREDAMSEVAKKVLSVHFRKMEANEKGTRKGEDIEKLHDMRVAVRRMRTAATIFGRFLDPDDFGPFVRELRTLGRCLGPVRDMDVILDHARSFYEKLPMRERLDFENLFTLWEEERAKLRDRLLDYLESSAYGRFKRDFAQFLADASAGVLPVVTKKGRVRPSLLSHEGPVVLFERLAAVRAYEGWLDGEDVPLRRYHRLRIDVKRIRYTLEFLSDVIGPEAVPLIEAFKAAQDHLGEMREAWMTADLIEQDFLPLGVDGPKAGAHPGIAAYLTARRTRSEELRKSFPEIWTTVNNREVHRRIAAIAASF